MEDSKPLHPLILRRLSSVSGFPDEFQVNEAKQIIQELILYALAKSEFFKYASFHGGTALRILYKTRRFSEDLDFSLRRGGEGFHFSSHLKAVQAELRKRIEELDFKSLRKDVSRFVEQGNAINHWDKHFFSDLISSMSFGKRQGLSF